MAQTRGRRPATKAPPQQVEIGAELWEEYRNAREQEARWKKIADDARTEIEAKLGDSPFALADGVPVISWQQEQKRKQFNRKAFAAAHPDIDALYTELVPGNRPFKPLVTIVVEEED